MCYQQNFNRRNVKGKSLSWRAMVSNGIEVYGRDCKALAMVNVWVTVKAIINKGGKTTDQE